MTIEGSDLPEQTRRFNNFKFSITGTVKIKVSGQEGEVVGRAEYRDENNSYYVLYVDSSGDAQRGWFCEGELVTA